MTQPDRLFARSTLTPEFRKKYPSLSAAADRLISGAGERRIKRTSPSEDPAGDLTPREERGRKLYINLIEIESNSIILAIF